MIEILIMPKLYQYIWIKLLFQAQSRKDVQYTWSFMQKIPSYRNQLFLQHFSYILATFPWAQVPSITVCFIQCWHFFIFSLPTLQKNTYLYKKGLNLKCYSITLVLLVFLPKSQSPLLSSNLDQQFVTRWFISGSFARMCSVIHIMMQGPPSFALRNTNWQNVLEK